MIVSISGGIGNQMFQYAFGYAFCKKHNKKFVQDLFCFNLEKNRDYVLNQYRITNTDVSYCKGFLYYFGNRILKNGVKNLYWRRLKHIFKDSSPLVYVDVPENCQFAIGNWLNEQYFAGYRNELISEFQYNGEFNDVQKKFLDVIENQESIAVHVRRGDYLKPENNAYCVIERDYYERAIKYLKEMKPNSIVYFFSDDIEWCKNTFRNVENAFYIDSNVSGDPNIDLELMRKCKYFIIANSTFSWWGAWLSERQDKIMVAPSKWFNGKKNEIYNYRVKKALLKDYIVMYN